MRNFLWAYVHLEGSDWLVLINKKSDSLLNHFWSGGLDSNQRPLHPMQIRYRAAPPPEPKACCFTDRAANVKAL